MALFAANPLSLSVPDSTLESWLRDSGYLDLLDDHASAPPPSSTPRPPLRPSSSASAAARTLLAIITRNPFAKLTADDFARDTPPWTVAFVGPAFSWPTGPTQARLRVQENVKRYARNYAFLALLIFGCSLYQMPKSLVGLISCLGLWEGLRLCSNKWRLEERCAGIRSILVLVAQFATAFVLYYCNLQIAVLSAISFSYAVMLMHASLRRLSSSNQSVGSNRQRRFQSKRELSSECNMRSYALQVFWAFGALQQLR